MILVIIGVFLIAVIFAALFFSVTSGIDLDMDNLWREYLEEKKNETQIP